MASAKWKKFSKIKVTSTFSPIKEGEIEIETTVEASDEDEPETSEEKIVVETKPKRRTKAGKKLLKG